MATVTPNTCASPLGRITAIRTGSTAPIAVALGNTPLQSLGLCVKLSVHQSVIAQFQTTLGNYIYITPFGDKPGDIALTFIVNTACGATEKTMDAIKYYSDSRLRPTELVNIAGVTYVRRSTSIRIAVGNLALRGFLTGLDIDGSTESSAIIYATLRLTGWPE